MRVRIRAIIREYAQILDAWYDSALSDTSKPVVLAAAKSVAVLAIGKCRGISRGPGNYSKNRRRLNKPQSLTL
jgi:hypothetical protein